jgi:HEAT repeat protein
MTDFSTQSTKTLLAKAEQVARKDVERDSQERYELVSELHKRGGEEAFRAAAAWCRASDPQLKSFGADVLGQLGATKEGNPYASQSAPVLMPLLNDKDPRVIESALVALGHLREGDLARVAALASHEDSLVRHGVAFCLGGRESDLALRTLIQMTTDDDSVVRDWATFAVATLSNVDTPEVRSALVARLKDEDADTRGEAMRGLATRRDDRVVPAIVAELQLASVSDLAVEAAAEMPRAEYVPFLQALTESNPTASNIYVALDACKAVTARK